MKAILCHEAGPPSALRYEEIADPVPKKGQVLVEVRAAGVNFPDLLIIQGLYQFKPPFPFSPGGEVAGVVKAVGEGVEAYKPGDRVIGAAIWGGFAEQILFGEEQLLPMPEGMSFEEAAGFVLTYATALYALEDRAALKAGETVLVLGAAGGVGSAAIEVAKAMGAKVIAAAGTREKLEFCRSIGADEVICYADEDLKKRAKSLSGGGVDVVVDPVGGPYSEEALRALAWEGRLLVIGFAAGDIPKIPLNLVLLKSCQLVGVFWGALTMRDRERQRQIIEKLGRLFAEGKVRPRISATYPLARAGEALEAVGAREVKGKAILVP